MRRFLGLAAAGADAGETGGAAAASGEAAAAAETASAAGAAATASAASGEAASKPHFLSFDSQTYRLKTALKLQELPISERALDKEDSFSPTLDMTTDEAARCLNCGCYAVNPSDITPVLVALGATLVTNQRSVAAEDFCCQTLKVSDALQAGEIIERIDITLRDGTIDHYDKFRVRNALDFAIVSLASAFKVEAGAISAASLVLGGVAPVPLRAKAAEDYLVGQPVNEQTAAEAAELAAKAALSLEHNAYKVLELKALVKSAIMRLRATAD
jgi:hypothetical protein